MSRLANAILDSSKAYAKGHQAPMLDLTYGGQQGYAPDLTEWVSNQAYIRRNLICLLVSAPTGFASMPHGDKYIATLKSLVELHAQTIEGLAAGLSIETVETAVGGAGEMQEHFTNVTRARSQPVFRFEEKYGLPVFNFFSSWVRWLMMDPDSKVATVGTLAAGQRPTDMLADRYAATMAFIEPDPTHTKVVKSWLITNMFPKGDLELVGRRELSAASEQTTYDVNFTALSQFGEGVDAFCQTLLDKINLVNANPYKRPAFVSKIDADVSAAGGYGSKVDTLASAAASL